MRLALFLSCGVLAALVSTPLLAGCSTGASDEAAAASEDLGVLLPGVDETSLDRTADPCQDFYQFACGGYIARAPDPEVVNVTGSYGRRAFIELQTQRNEILDTFLDEPPTSPVQAKVDAYYRSCLEEDFGTLGSLGLALKQQAAAVATPADVATMAAQALRNGENAFLAVYAGRRTRRIVATLYGGGFDYGTNYADDASRGAREDTIRALLTTVFASTLAGDEADRIATNSVAIEQALGAASSASARNAPNGQTATPQSVFVDLAPSFDWATYFHAIGLAPSADVLVGSVGFLPAFEALIAASAKDLGPLRDYLLIHSLEGLTTHAQSVITPAQPKVCKDDVSLLMSEAIEPRFLELAGVGDDARQKARAMFDVVKAAFRQRLDAATFLDPATRAAAETKLAMTTGAIGESPALDDFADLDLTIGTPIDKWQRLTRRAFDRMIASVGQPVATAHIDASPATVSAWTEEDVNKITIPGGMLGGFFFSPQASKIANSGGIGVTFGHEMGHGFDSGGHLLDGNGDPNDWWSSAAAAEYGKRTKCLVDQYSAFELPGVADPLNGAIPAHVNGQQTLDENIADNLGIPAAFTASKAETKDGPLVSGFTPAQQFFVGHAQSYCSRLTPDQTSVELSWEAHAPPKARVNVTFGNFDRFARAFQCAPGTTMAPENRCVLW